MGADALSDVLKTVRLTGATFFDVVGKTPWVAEQPTREAVLPLILPGAEHLIAYHERFTDLLGIPPMQYLAQWRMQIAAGLLTNGNANMASIATDIGYESEASFSRAFKKSVGVSPSVWRRKGEAGGVAALS